MSEAKKLPSVRYLRECFLHDKTTGKLFWKRRPAHHFAEARIAKAWNTRFAGREAFTYQNSRGYYFGQLDCEYLAAHRVVWKLFYGKEPPPIIDHANRNSGNNKIKNLREATKSQNCINRSRNNKNRSGCGGVHKHRNKGKWVAQLGLRARKRYLGIFDSKEKAAAVWREAATKEYGVFLPCM